MSARPPPTRPHIGLNPSSYLSYSWAEEDAWDSGSDSDSPSTNTQAPTAWSRSPTASTLTSSPKAVNVPRPSSNSSSSTLAFSYTHVSAPSSYPPKQEEEQSAARPSKNGWTLVQKSGQQSSRPSTGGKETSAVGKSHDGEVEEAHDVDGEMVVGDMDPDFSEPFTSMKSMPISTVREDVEEIVNGMSVYSFTLSLSALFIHYLDPLHLIRRISSKRAHSSSSYSPLRSRSRSPPPDQGRPESPETLLRERSIRSNRRNKFVQCLLREDVDMGAFTESYGMSTPLMPFATADLRRLAWQGVPNDLRPLAWQLLLVSSFSTCISNRCSSFICSLPARVIFLSHLQPAPLSCSENEANTFLWSS